MAKNVRDFGSFHASNVQDTINLPEDQYTPPKIPIDLQPFHDKIELGTNCRKSHFYLEEECIFINHGAFGSVLKPALEAAQKWQIYTERQPLRFFDRELIPLLVYTCRQLAKFVGCNPSDLVLVPNVTTAINTVVKGINLKKGDTVYMLNVTYGAVKKLLRWQCEQTGAVLQEEEVTFPISGKQQILDMVSSTLNEGTSLAVFDHIPSNTPFIMPVQEIIQICRQKKVPVLIDGAHALGALDINMRTLDADYYISNAHKWFCAPKGSAFMFVREELQTSTRPLIISHGFGSGFNSEFIWAGLHDYSPYLALNTVIDFWQSVGVDTIRQYIYTLCQQACDLLTRSWGTSLAAPKDMFGSMALVQVPPVLYSDTDMVEYKDAEALQNQLYHQFNIEVPVKCICGVLYVRISCHIYNELNDYKKLVEAVLTLSQNKQEEK